MEKYSYIEQIIKVLGNPIESFPNNWNWKLIDENSKQVLFLSLYLEVQNPSKMLVNLVSVQTSYGYFELHGFTKILPIEPDEIAFISINENKLNCMIIGKNCTCSLYSNIDKSLIKTNFSTLDNPLLLSAMQLALFEDLL